MASSSSRSHQFVNCIQEMEDTEEILSERWKQIQNSGQSRPRSTIERMMVKLRERQCVTSAALQALDAYERLKSERFDFRGRKDAVVNAFRQWLSHVEGESGGSSTEEEMDEDDYDVMQKYTEYRKLCRKFAKKWTSLRECDKKLSNDLHFLNARFAPFTPKLLRTMKDTKMESFQWPTTHCQKLSATVELAFDQINYLTKLLNEIDDKLESLEVFFRINQSTIALVENHEGAPASEMEVNEDERN